MGNCNSGKNTDKDNIDGLNIFLGLVIIILFIVYVITSKEKIESTFKNLSSENFKNSTFANFKTIDMTGGLSKIQSLMVPVPENAIIINNKEDLIKFIKESCVLN